MQVAAGVDAHRQGGVRAAVELNQPGGGVKVRAQDAEAFAGADGAAGDIVGGNRTIVES